MKKLCSFFVLLFALAIFVIPTKAKALSSDLNITVHNTTWDTIYSCTNCTGFGNNGVYANVYPYRSMLVYFPTYQAIQGNTYHLIFEYEMYVTDGFQPTDNLVFQINGTAQTLNVIQYVKEHAEMPNGQFWTFTYEAEFKASVSGITMRLEIAPNGQNNNYYSTLYEMNVSNWSLINYGIDSNTQAIVESQDKMNETLNDINNYMTDSTPPSSDISSLANVQGLLPAGPVDSLLNIPFKFLSVIVSSLGELCTPLSFDFIFNSQLTIPCFQSVFYDNVPSGLMIFINLIPSAFILIKYFKHLYKKVDRATSLNSNADDEWGVL